MAGIRAKEEGDGVVSRRPADMAHAAVDIWGSKTRQEISSHSFSLPRGPAGVQGVREERKEWKEAALGVGVR